MWITLIVIGIATTALDADVTEGTEAMVTCLVQVGIVIRIKVRASVHKGGYPSKTMLFLVDIY